MISQENNPYLSFVAPVYNEEGNVRELHRRILEVMVGFNRPFEVIFVNDGSNDNTLKNLESLKPLKIINFRKNFGQTAAMDAGIKAAKGEIIATLDGDLQNDPHDIPEMIKMLADGFDVISGWRKDRHDPFLKRIVSRGANFLRGFLIHDGIHDSGCSLKVYKRECFATVDLFGEMHRFIPAILKLKGYKIGEMVVAHHPRLSGKTKYSWKRVLKGFLDMVSVWFWKKYANRPLHLFGGLGLGLIFISIIAGLVALYQRIFWHQDLTNTMLSFLSLFGFLTGVQFIVFGLLADILSKNYYTVTKDTPYIVKEIIENK